jgi:hypothetical protein
MSWWDAILSAIVPATAATIWFKLLSYQITPDDEEDNNE